ncbi:MAG TPA: glycosyltransferase family 2 protein [Solirubrobacteraceae bacterium]|nr:glycosyltransferase family 2 protein [Solirubrobacteraceae bacterium]
MTADVVVVSYNGGEHLITCLEHLRGAARPGVRVIVADNASTDGSATAVRARFADVTVLELPENAGFGRAVNAGAAAGDGEAIVLVNADMFVEPGFVEAILAPFSDPAVGMVAGLSLVLGGELVDGFGIEVDAGLSAYNRLRLRPVGSAPGVLLGPSGGAAAYRRSAFEAAEGFDDAFFAYGEDVDLALRLRALGWRAAAAPEARGVHLGGASFGVGSPLQRRLGGFARGFLLRRYGVLRSRACVRALVTEALVVGWGLVRFRTAVPLTARVAGWRAAGGSRLPVPPEAVDRSITLREAVRRLARAR